MSNAPIQVIGLDYPNQASAPQERIVRRRRYQKGSLQARRHGKKRVWVVQYYDADGHHRYHTLGRMCDLTKSQAEEKQTAFMQTVNGGEDVPPGITQV